MFFTFLWCCLCNPPWVTGGLSDFKVLRRFNPTFSLRSQVYRWRRSVFFWHFRATLGLACAQAAILCTQVVGYSHNAGIRPATPSTIPVSSVSPPCVRNLSLGLCLRLQRMLSFLFLCPYAGIRPATPLTIPVSSVSPPCVRNLSLGLCLCLQRMLSFLFLCPFRFHSLS